MDMIRWLATNKVVLTVWGLGILAILLASIFGGGKDAEHAAAPVETKAVEVVAEKAKPVTAAVEAVAEKVKAAPAAVAAAATGTAAVVASTVQAAVDTSAEAVTEVSAEANVSEETVAKAVEVVAQTEEKAVEAVDTSADSSAASDQAAVAVEDDNLAGKSSDDLLMMAREAYWDNGLDKAANLYSELIAREPTVIEHKGELGNVFWRQGYPKKAAELYADIAQPMIEKGNGERVSNMVGFIGLFFPERATSIRTLLDAQ